MFKTKKNIYLLFFVLCYPLIVFCQPFTHFNKQVLLDESNQLSVATIPHENGYYTVGVFGFTHTIIYFANTDIEGNILNHHILDDSPDVTTVVSGRQFIQTSDGQFLLLYGKWIDNSDVDIFLRKFTTEGNILWTQQFGWEGIDGQGEVIETKDGGFLITGFVETINHIEMYAVKTDSRGSMEWENSYCFNQSCKALSVVETMNGDYILAGYGKTEEDDFDMYVVKIDSLGNQLWDKTYGTSEDDPACQVYALNDGNFLLEGGIRENGIRKNYNAKLDPNGEIIWEKVYSIPTIRTIQSPVVVREDDSFIGVAYTINEQDNTHPLIMNFNSEGDTLWTKPITADPNADCYIKDIDKIEGGYVLTGYKFSPTPQYGWIVTIDEEGNFCEELGCVETVVDIEDIAVEEEIFMRISPNPVREKATIQYQIPNNQEGVLKVYDYQGRLINKEELKINNSHLVLDVGDWNSGVYLYQLEIGGESIKSGKLVVK